MRRQAPLRRRVPLRGRSLWPVHPPAPRRVLAPPASPPPLRLVVVSFSGLLRPQPPRTAEARIEDGRYLRWIRTLDCWVSGPGEQVTQTVPHHAGRHPLSRKTHDWLTIPLSWEVHEHLHATGSFPGWSIEATRAEIPRAQLLLLCRYFAPQLGPSADRWAALAEVAEALPLRERPLYLRRVLQQLIGVLAHLRATPAAILPPWEGPDLSDAERRYLVALDESAQEAA